MVKKKSVCDSNHSMCQPDGLKHSLFRHLWRLLKIPQDKHDPGWAQDGRTWSEYIHVLNIISSQKKIDQSLSWSVASNQSGAWCLGRQSRRCSRYFDLHVACKVCFVCFLQSVLVVFFACVLGMIFALFVVSVIFCSGPTWPTMYTMLKMAIFYTQCRRSLRQ